MPLAISALLFGSGFCALVYQVAWLRELRLVFGASTAASAAVLAVFMGGLGAGGLYFGKRAVARRRPLALYAELELAIAFAAALTPGAIWLAQRLYAAAGGTLALGQAGGTLARLLLAAVVLGVPTFLMGGTLPAAAQAVETDEVGRRRLALLYGANTLGAVLGSSAATFALLEILGIRRMLWSACALNALVAMAARVLARRMPEAPAHTEARPASEAAASGGTLEAPPAAPKRLVLIAAAAVGFAFLLMELVWYRMLAPILGGSSYTFGLILAVALLGIGLGGIAYALLFGHARPTLRAFALTCGAEALVIALPFALGDRLALSAAMLRALGALGFAGLAAGWTVIAFAVVLPAALVSGVQFPLLIALVGRGRAEVGRDVGLAYAWNTGGAIVGSLAGGFGLLPLLGALGAWRLVVVLLAALGLAALLWSFAAERRLGRALPPLLVLVGALVLIGARGPTAAWRHGAIGVGRGPKEGTPNTLRNFLSARRRSIVWEADGIESSVAVHAENGYAFVVNGKIDGNARLDAPTQVMGGLLGALLHGHVRTAMVVGLGTGSTAGWLGAVPAIERVDVAELEPSIRRVAKLCAPVNQDVLANPKVRIALGDAREQLLTTRARYDLIFSEPSNPYRAGVSSLFTREFYQAARTRLEPGGFLVQWLQAYSVDAQTVRTTYATLAQVFLHVETWLSEEGDLLLVAGDTPLAHDLGALAARMKTEPYRTALLATWRVTDIEGLYAHFVAGAGFARAIAANEHGDVSTDDLTLVEFGFARGVGQGGLLRTSEVREAAHARGDDRPPVSGGTLDPARVDSRRLSMMAAQGLAPSLPYRVAPDVEKRGEALDAWLDDDYQRALTAWRTAPREPDDSVQLLMLADTLAEQGDEAALGYIERLRAVSTVEADGCKARLELRRGHLEPATLALEAAFRAWRTDPWPLPVVMKSIVKLAPEVGRKDPKLGARLYDALAEPFAVHELDAARRDARRELAELLGGGRCVEAISAYEPEPPWEHEFLEARRRCYEQAHDPRAARARRDLQAFVDDEPVAFGSGLLQRR